MPGTPGPSTGAARGDCRVIFANRREITTQMLVADPSPPGSTRPLAYLPAWPGSVYVVATTLGLLLRAVYVGVPAPLPFDHLLHAHSHALYFGWAGLAVLVAAAGRRRRVRRWAWAALVSTLPLLVGFLIQGYGPVSIAASTVVMLVWYGGMISWWRGRRGQRGPAGVGVALAYVVVASAGIWVLAPVLASGGGDTLAAALAIHAFLSGFAWAMVMGAAALVADLGLVAVGPTRRALAGWAATAWLLFPLGVAGGPEVPGLGAAARLAGILVLFPTWHWLRGVWIGVAADEHRSSLRASAVFLVVAVSGLAAVSVGGTAVLSFVGRQGVVMYLHALLLGGVTTMLVCHLGVGSRGIRLPLRAHVVGVAVMLGGIALLAAGSGTGAWMALLGATVTWAAGLFWAASIWRREAG